MANLKEIKKRIENVGVIEKITNSMKAISTARLSSIKLIKANTADFYKVALDVMHILYNFYKDMTDLRNVLFDALYGKSDIQTTLIIFITSDKGLCGAYNSNVLRAVNKLSKELGSYLLLPIGLKAIYFTNKLDANLVVKNSTYCDLQRTSQEDILLLSYKILDLVKTSKISKIKIVSTINKSILQQEILITDLLPFVPNMEENNNVNNEYVATDDTNLMNSIEHYLINYFTYVLFDKILNSLLAEYSARLNAMDGANDNSKELKTQLKLQYNRTRQALITKELIEIVSGAEAL